MEISRSNIFGIVNMNNARPDKDYGQNFLIEPAISSKIVDLLEVKKNEAVLEIGPGLGSLTHYLSEQSENLSVCDIDIRMINFLGEVYGRKINYIYNDIRKVDVSNFDKIIGNLPYNITTELVTYLLLNAKNVKKMVLMCQLEAFNRFYDEKGENYGPTSVLIHLLGESKKEFVVKAGNFYPVPKCSSVVFTFKKELKASEEEILGTYKLSKSLFINRRKTIYNNLKNYLNDSLKAKMILETLKISELDRPENIHYLDYLKMYRLIKERS